MEVENQINIRVNAPNSVIKEIKELLARNQELKALLAEINKDMFTFNTHAWRALKESTIKSKRSMMKHGRLASFARPDSINIASGDTYTSLVSTDNIRSLVGKNVTFEFRTNAQVENRIAYAKDQGRRMDNLTQTEKDRILNMVKRIIREHYATK